jgi:hypothetical protein
VEKAAKEDLRFLDTLRRCWVFGQAVEHKNARRLDRLVRGRRAS